MTRRLAVTTIGLIICGGCAGDRGGRGEETLMRIEVLGFAGCPNTPTMQEHVGEAIARSGIEARVVYVDQESLAPSDLRRGYPTPTVLVEGADLFGLPTPTEPAMGCRVYADGVPSVEEIASRLSSWR